MGYAIGRFNEIGGWGSCKYLRSVNAENFIQYIDAVLETGLVINRVQDPVARMVLEKRYLEFMTIVEIAKGADHSERWGRMRHAEGLRAVREILDSDGAGGLYCRHY